MKLIFFVIFIIYCYKYKGIFEKLFLKLGTSCYEINIYFNWLFNFLYLFTLHITM